MGGPWGHSALCSQSCVRRLDGATGSLEGFSGEPSVDKTERCGSGDGGRGRSKSEGVKRPGEMGAAGDGVCLSGASERHCRM